jgi:hypothetical protein
MARDKAKGTRKLSDSSQEDGAPGPRPAWALICIALGVALSAASAQSMLGTSVAADALASRGLMARIDGWLSGNPASLSGTVEPDVPPFAPIFLMLAAVSVITWLAGAWWISHRAQISFAVAAATWGSYGWLWWVAGGSWEIVRLLVVALGILEWQLFVESSASFWIATGVAGWMATFLTLAAAKAGSGQELPSELD